MYPETPMFDELVLCRMQHCDRKKLTRWLVDYKWRIMVYLDYWVFTHSAYDSVLYMMEAILSTIAEVFYSLWCFACRLWLSPLAFIRLTPANCCVIIFPDFCIPKLEVQRTAVRFSTSQWQKLDSQAARAALKLPSIPPSHRWLSGFCWLMRK